MKIHLHPIYILIWIFTTCSLLPRPTDLCVGFRTKAPVSQRLALCGASQQHDILRNVAGGCGENRLKAVCALGANDSSSSTSRIPDTRFYKVLLGASVAARVVVAFNSQHSHSSTDNYHDHDHHHSHGSKEKETEDHDRSHGSCNHDLNHEHSHSHSEPREEHHKHSHGCHHSHGHSTALNAVQRLIKTTSEVFGIAAIAEAWRENLTVVCISTALLLLGAAVPLVLPQAASYQKLLVIPALPLTGVPALLDATIDVAGGKVNFHVLVAFAALASVFMGSALEGGLLLAMFSLSHLAEDYFTEKAMGDVKALKDSNPGFALVLDDFDQKKAPPLSSIPYKQLPVKDVAVGSYLLVKAGEKSFLFIEPLEAAKTSGLLIDSEVKWSLGDLHKPCNYELLASWIL